MRLQKWYCLDFSDVIQVYLEMLKCDIVPLSCVYLFIYLIKLYSTFWAIFIYSYLFFSLEIFMFNLNIYLLFFPSKYCCCFFAKIICNTGVFWEAEMGYYTLSYFNLLLFILFFIISLNIYFYSFKYLFIFLTQNIVIMNIEIKFKILMKFGRHL